MRTKILTVLILLFAGLQIASAARIKFGKEENIKVVHEFPNTEDFESSPGRYVDLGILYETFNVVGVPLWVTKDPVIVGTENMNTEVYFDIDEQFKNEILKEYNLNEEKLVELSFMDKHGGFIWLGGAFVLVIIIGMFVGGGEDEDEIEEIPEQSQT